MAKRSSLFIRIVEGKNLPAKDITGSSDPYCIVKIDNETIIRTATVWKTLFPFWGEEYEVHLSPSFHCVSFYVMDEDALSRDDVIGKVCIPQSLLADHPKGYSGWLNLTEIDPDEEVQGEIHLQIEIIGNSAARKLRCVVFDARDLARKDRNGASDPFVRVRYNSKIQETSVIKKSCYPRWNETFEFDMDESATEKLCIVEVWDWDLVSRNDFLGKVVFNVQRLKAVQREEGWFLLRPDKSKPRLDEGNLGSLHLQVQLRDEMVLPSIYYQPFVELLCQEVKTGIKNQKVHLITLIDETTTAECRQELAVNLVKLFLGQGLIKEFLDLLFKLELDKTSEPNTLFRSNSLASKSMESFLKVAGMQYLHRILRPSINRVFEEKRYIELDPSKVESKEIGCSSLHRIHSESEVIQQSGQFLQSYLTDLLNTITRSAKMCPPVIRATFQLLYKRVAERFPEEKNQNVKFIAITSFLCLRFFSPAIMSPKLFHLREKHADAHISRALLLLAKKSSFVPLTSIRAAEKVEEKSFGISHVMQIIYTNDAGQEDTAYLQCKCVNELSQWLSALRKVCGNNVGMLCSYHPGVFRGDKWSCCHLKDKAGLGCDKTRHGVTLREWNDPLDPDLEAQLIFQHLLAIQEVMREKYEELSVLEKNEKHQSEDPENADRPFRLFQILHDLEEMYQKEVSRSTDMAQQNQNHLVELQT